MKEFVNPESDEIAKEVASYLDKVQAQKSTRFLTRSHMLLLDRVFGNNHRAALRFDDIDQQVGHRCVTKYVHDIQIPVDVTLQSALHAAIELAFSRPHPPLHDVYPAGNG